jgi:hypothetical protein
MPNQKIPAKHLSVNHGNPASFRTVGPSCRLVVTSTPETAHETALRVVSFSQVAAARTIDFLPVVNPSEGGTSVEDCKEVQNKQDQQASNSNGQNEYGPTSRQKFSGNGVTDSPKQPGKAPASPQPSGYGLPPVSALSLLMILEQTPRSPK